MGRDVVSAKLDVIIQEAVYRKQRPASFLCGKYARETLIISNSPRSNNSTHAAEFDTLRYNQRIP